MKNKHLFEEECKRKKMLVPFKVGFVATSEFDSDDAVGKEDTGVCQSKYYVILISINSAR